MKQTHFPLILTLLAATLAGCAAGGLGSADYNRGEVRGEQSVRLATVMSVRAVRIAGTSSGAGTLAGAAVGGIAGNSAGRGNGNALATVAGVVVGAVAGSALENGATRENGIEVTVQFANGKLSAITQGADEQFAVGERVTVVSGHGVTRVSKLAAGSALTVPPPPVGSAPGNYAPPQTSAPAPAATPPRWYCPNKGYYPEVPTCTDKWLQVSQ